MQEHSHTSIANEKKKLAILIGASSGLGKAFALAMDERDDFDSFLLIARREELLVTLADSLQHDAEYLAGDILEEEFLDAILRYIEDANYTVQYLLVSAGFGRSGMTYDLGQINGDMVRLNALALTDCNTMLLPYMHKGSCIFNVSSVAAYLPQYGFATYAATKAYVLRFSRALHAELKEKGIQVMAVCPNPMETDFFRDQKGGGVKGIKRLALEDPNKVARKALRRIGRKDVSLSNLSAYLILACSKLLPERFMLWLEKLTYKP